MLKPSLELMEVKSLKESLIFNAIERVVTSGQNHTDKRPVCEKALKENLSRKENHQQLKAYSKM